MGCFALTSFFSISCAVILELSRLSLSFASCSATIWGAPLYIDRVCLFSASSPLSIGSEPVQAEVAGSV